MRRSIMSLAAVMVVCLSAQLVRADQSSGIVWHTDSYKAYREASDKKVPLVVYFYGEDGQSSPRVKCKWCVKLENETLNSPQMATYASRAVFAQINVGNELTDNEKRLVKDLDIKSVPVVAVLHCQADRIQEVARVAGHFETPVFIEKFAGALDLSVKRIAATDISTGDETARIRELLQKMVNQARALETAENNYKSMIAALATNGSFDSDRFAASYATLSNEFGGTSAMTSEIERLSTSEARAVAAVIRRMSAAFQNRYVQSYNDIMSASRTVLTSTTAGASAATVAANWHKSLVEFGASAEVKEIQIEFTAAVSAFAQRYKLN